MTREEQSVAFVEFFFDLVFIFSRTQVQTAAIFLDFNERLTVVCLSRY